MWDRLYHFAPGLHFSQYPLSLSCDFTSSSHFRGGEAVIRLPLDAGLNYVTGFAFSNKMLYSEPISVMQGTVSPSFLPQRMGAGPKMGTGKRSIGPVCWPGTGGPWKAAYLTASLTPWQNREPDPEGSHDLHKVGVSSTEGGSLLCPLHFLFASP